MPDPERLLTILRHAAQLWKATPGRAGRIVNLTGPCQVLVCGDLHGNIENFRLLLKRADLAAQPRRHLVLQEVVHSAFRYPDGGDKSHQLTVVIVRKFSRMTTSIFFKSASDLRMIFRDSRMTNTKFSCNLTTGVTIFPV